MGRLLVLATEDGVRVCLPGGDGWVEGWRALPGKVVTCLTGTADRLLAGTTQGIYRSTDSGQTWEAASQGLQIPHVRWLAGSAYHALAGTEPAGIFVSQDGGERWQACPEVQGMNAEYGWYLPYSPERGAVRGFALHEQHAYAAVEDGCVLLSTDYGQTWQLAPGSNGHSDHRPEPGWIHSDVHSIEVHPVSPDLLYAPTGGGLYHSADGGRTWTNLYRCYCRAVWVDPDDPSHMIFGPADGVDRNGRIEETQNGGRTWILANEGLQNRWPEYMVERFHQSGDELLAVLSNGELLISPLPELHWQPVELPDLPHVHAAWSIEAETQEGAR